MNRVLLTAAVLAISLGTILGAPVLHCSKLEDIDSNNRYLVLLENDHTKEDAERIIEAVSEYEYSQETSGSGSSAEEPSIRSQLNYLPCVRQLQGTLSVQAISLVNCLSLIHTHSTGIRKQ